MHKAVDFIVRDGIFILLLALVFGVPIICSPYNQANVFLIKAVYFQSVVFVAFIFLLSRKILTRESFTHIPLAAPMVLFLSIGLLSLAFSSYKYAVLEEFLRYLSFFLFYVLIIQEVSTDKKKMLMIDFLIAATLIAGLYGIFHSLGFNPFTWVPAEAGRVVSFFGNPNFFATYLVAVIPLLLVLSLGPHKKRKFPAIITSGIALICLLLTQTRSAWIALIVSLVFLFLLIHKTKAMRFSPRNRLILAIILSVICITVIFNQGMIRDRITELWNPYGSAFIRMHIWQAELSMIGTYPLFGSGLGTFQIVFPGFRYPGFLSEVPIGNLLHVHSEYIEILAEMGIVGLGLFLWFVIGLLRRALRFLKTGREERLVVIGLVFGVVAVLIDALFSASLRWTGPAFVFWLLIGLTAAMTKSKNESPKETPRKPRSLFIHAVVILAALLSSVLIARWHVRKYEANIYLAKAHTFLNKGQKDRATSEYHRALEKEPDCVLALYLLGCLSVEKKDFQQAQKWFEKLDRLAPHFANVHEWKGHLSLQLGDLATAEEEYKICAKLKDSVRNHNMLGRTYALQKKWDLAIDQFQRACELGSRIAEPAVDFKALALTDFEAGQSGKAAPRPEPEDFTQYEKEAALNAHILLGNVHYEKGDYQKAIEPVEKLASENLNLDQQNKVAQLYYNVAWAYAEAEENLDEALRICQNALKVNQSRPELTHDIMAWIYLKKGDSKQAKEEIEKALQIAPDNKRLREHLSIIELAIKGKLKKADISKIDWRTEK